MIDIIAGVNAAFETLKKLKEVNEKVKNADVKMLIADLSMQLADAKISISELLDKNRALEEEIKSLKGKESEKLIYKNGAYYSSDGDGPFCPGCYDEKGKKYRIAIISADFEFTGIHKCTVCGKTVAIKKT